MSKGEKINQLQFEIDNEVMTLLALDSPEENGLGNLISTAKISDELNKYN